MPVSRFIQHAHGSGGTGLSSVTLGDGGGAGFPSDVTAGRVFFWFIAYSFDANTTPRTISFSSSRLQFTQSNAVIVAGVTGVHNYGFAIATSSGSTNATATFSTAIDYPGFYIQERDDIDPAVSYGIEDAYIAITGTGTHISNNTPFLAKPNSVIFGVGENWDGPNPPAAVAGFTDHGSFLNYGAGSPATRFVSKVLNSGNPTNVSFTASINNQYVLSALVLVELIAPSFSLEPISQTYHPNNTITFRSMASGGPTYQWQINTGVSWQDITGETGNTYTTGTLTDAENGYQYRVIATNAVASTTSNSATITYAPTMFKQYANNAFQFPSIAEVV